MSVLPSAFIAALHYVALALGFASVVARGLGFRALKASPTDEGALKRTLAADSVWGLAALLWLGSGLARLLGPFEKGVQFYLHNGFFHAKMAAFVGVVLLELLPMVTLIRWRIAKPKGATPWSTAPMGRLIRLNDAQTVLVLLTPVLASLMARGVWMF